jgi:hypothetical protein
MEFMRLFSGLLCILSASHTFVFSSPDKTFLVNGACRRRSTKHNERLIMKKPIALAIVTESNHRLKTEKFPLHPVRLKMRPKPSKQVPFENLGVEARSLISKHVLMGPRGVKRT